MPSLSSLLADSYNPLDAIEAVLTTYNLDFARMDEDELVLSVAGQCTSYRLFLTWQDEFGALQVICQFPTEMVPTYEPALARLLMAANAQLWLGHFECAEDRTLQFRYTTLLPHKERDEGVDQMNELFKLAVAECDRFYPALKMLCDHTDVPLSTLAFAMQDTAGMG